MNQLHERIALCIAESGLTKTAFGKRIHLSQPHISRIAAGDAQPSDRTLSDICREFGISETWLRTGEGPMRDELSRTQQIASFMDTVLASSSSDVRWKLVSVLSQLEEDEWAALEKISRRFFE